jgi:hypothetical protein
MKVKEANKEEFIENSFLDFNLKTYKLKAVFEDFSALKPDTAVLEVKFGNHFRLGLGITIKKESNGFFINTKLLGEHFSIGDDIINAKNEFLAYLMEFISGALESKIFFNWLEEHDITYDELWKGYM